jgi:hypothetical protein
MAEKLPENYLSVEFYQPMNIKIKRRATFLIGIVLFSFVLHFPLFQIIDTQIQKVIAGFSSQKCPLSIGQVQYGFLMPKVVFKNINIPGQCFNKGDQQVFLPHLNISWSGASFSPLGLKFTGKTELNSSPILFHFIVGLTQMTFVMKDNQIQSQALASFEPNIAKVKALLRINAVIEWQKLKLKSGQFRIESTNLSILPISYFGMTLPNLNVGKLVIQGQYKNENGKQTIFFQDNDDKSMGVNIGSPETSLMLNLRGVIELNSFSIANSEIKSTLELKVGNEINQQIPLIDSLLKGSLTPNGDFYQGKISGTFAKPKITKI